MSTSKTQFSTRLRCVLITGSSGDRRKLIRAIFFSGGEGERGDPEHGVNVDKGLYRKPVGILHVEKIRGYANIWSLKVLSVSTQTCYYISVGNFICFFEFFNTSRDNHLILVSPRYDVRYDSELLLFYDIPQVFDFLFQPRSFELLKIVL